MNNEGGSDLKARVVVATVAFVALVASAFLALIIANTTSSNGTEEAGPCPRYFESASSADSIIYLPCCTSVEIYDPILAANGEKGRNAGKTSARFGCVPVCVWTASTDNDGIIDADEISLVRDKAELETGSVEAISAASNEAGDELLFETKNKFFDIDDDLTATSGAGFRFASGIAQVRVSPNQRDCLAYDVRGDRVFASTTHRASANSTRENISAHSRETSQSHG